MPILVKILGIVIIGMIIIFLVRIEVMNKILNYFIEEIKRIYFVGVLRIIIGAFLLFAASQCKIPIIILVLGILFLASGILVFLLGLERSKAFINWYVQRPPIQKRLIAVIALLFGALLVYAA